MTAVSLPSKVLGRNIKNFGAFLLKTYFWASWGSLLPHLPLPGYNTPTKGEGRKKNLAGDSMVSQHGTGSGVLSSI